MSGLKNSLNTNTTTVPVYPIKSSVTREKPHIPLDAEAGDETLEEQRLEAEGKQYRATNSGGTATSWGWGVATHRN